MLFGGGEDEDRLTDLLIQTPTKVSTALKKKKNTFKAFSTKLNDLPQINACLVPFLVFEQNSWNKIAAEIEEKSCGCRGLIRL